MRSDTMKKAKGASWGAAGAFVICGLLLWHCMLAFRDFYEDFFGMHGLPRITTMVLSVPPSLWCILFLGLAGAIVLNDTRSRQIPGGVFLSALVTIVIVIVVGLFCPLVLMHHYFGP